MGSTKDVHMSNNTIMCMLSCTDTQKGNNKTKTNVRMSFQLYFFLEFGHLYQPSKYVSI